jgi:translation initiation factor 1
VEHKYTNISHKKTSRCEKVHLFSPKDCIIIVNKIIQTQLMSNNDWKSRLGMVYSTNPDFKYETRVDETPKTLPLEKQNLRVRLESKGRAGKQVTLVTGFVGSEDDLSALAKLLKSKCCVGGSAKEGEVIVQGDFRERVVELLREQGYTRTKKV